MSTTESGPVSLRWRTVDIVVTAVVGVVCGVVFVGWNVATNVLGAPLFPPLKALLAGGWFLPAVLAPLIVRKPGAAIFAELLAAAVEMLLGGQFGITTLYSGLAQGLGAEVVFAALRYRSFGLATALGAGALSGLACGLVDTAIYNVGFSTTWTLLYIGCAIVSGLVLAGLVGWALQRALSGTGVLDTLASGRRDRRV